MKKVCAGTCTKTSKVLTKVTCTYKCHCYHTHQKMTSGMSLSRVRDTILLSCTLQVKTLARELYDQHFRAAQAKPRGVVAKLCSIVDRLEKACEKHSSVIKVSASIILVLSHCNRILIVCNNLNNGHICICCVPHFFLWRDY